MEPEKLKVIAEGMGYEVRLSELNEACTYGDSGGIWVVKKSPFMVGCYNPLTNNDQNSEIEVKLNLAVYPMWHKTDIIYMAEKVYSYANDNYPILNSDPHRGKTPQEARCNAAYEYFKSVNLGVGNEL